MHYISSIYVTSCVLCNLIGSASIPALAHESLSKVTIRNSSLTCGPRDWLAFLWRVTLTKRRKNHVWLAQESESPNIAKLRHYLTNCPANVARPKKTKSKVPRGKRKCRAILSSDPKGVSPTSESRSLRMNL